MLFVLTSLVRSLLGNLSAHLGHLGTHVGHVGAHLAHLGTHLVDLEADFSPRLKGMHSDGLTEDVACLHIRFGGAPSWPNMAQDIQAIIPRLHRRAPR